MKRLNIIYLILGSSLRNLTECFHVQFLKGFPIKCWTYCIYVCSHSSLAPIRSCKMYIDFIGPHPAFWSMRRVCKQIVPGKRLVPQSDLFGPNKAVGSHLNRNKHKTSQVLLTNWPEMNTQNQQRENIEVSKLKYQQSTNQLYTTEFKKMTQAE